MRGLRGTVVGPIVWHVSLLPYLDQEALWRQTLRAWDVRPNPLIAPPHAGLATVVRTFACPSDGRLFSPVTDKYGITAAYTSYLGVAGGKGTAYDGAPGASTGTRFADVTDGTSSTLLIGERPPPALAYVGTWYTMHHTSVAAYDYYRGPELFAAWPGDFGQCRGPFHFGPGRVENPCDSAHFWGLHSGGANFLLVDGSVHFLPYSAAGVLAALATRSGGEVVELP